MRLFIAMCCGSFVLCISACTSTFEPDKHLLSPESQATTSRHALATPKERLSIQNLGYVTRFKVIVVTSTRSNSQSRGQLHWIPPNGHFDMGWRLFPLGSLNQGETSSIEDDVDPDHEMIPNDFIARNTRLCLSSDDLWRPSSVRVLIQTTKSDGEWVETVNVAEWDHRRVFSTDYTGDKPPGGDAWCERDMTMQRVMPVHCDCD